MDSLSTTLAAMADPTRRSILNRLVAGPAAVNDIARPYRMSQQAVSKHLAYLERARLIRKKRDGRLHICTLNPAPFKEVAEWAGEFRRFWDTSYGRLDALLDQLKKEEEK